MTGIIVEGETFNVLSEGDEANPVLMLAHPIATNLSYWDPQVPAFLEHFRVVRYDCRGHGATRANDGPYSIERLGRDAIAILDALGIEKTHWLGVSMGGMVGLWLLINARERIGRAVLAGTAAQMPGPDMWNNRIRFARQNGMEPWRKPLPSAGSRRASAKRSQKRSSAFWQWSASRLYMVILPPAGPSATWICVRPCAASRIRFCLLQAATIHRLPPA